MASTTFFALHLGDGLLGVALGLRVLGLADVFVGDVDGVDAILCRAGQAAVAVEDGDLVLLHQEVKTLGVLDGDVVLALDEVVPVELRRVDAVDAVAAGVLEVVPDLGREEHRLGGDAAPVQAGAAELVGLFDEGDLQAVLRGADGAGVAGGAAANDDQIKDRLCQSFLLTTSHF